MLPNNGIDITQYDTTPQLSTSYTWKLDPNKDKIADFVDELDSVEQATYMMLRTERYKYEIYPDWYGIEVNDLYGQPRGLVQARLPRRIQECLSTDARIVGADGFTFEWFGGNCICRFTVQTVFGDFESSVDYELA